MECLRIVLAHLGHRHDIYSITTVLRINHFFAEATLPFLYANPFQDRFHLINCEEPVGGRRRILLTRILLRQASPENLTNLLTTFYFAKQDFDIDDHFDPSSFFVSEPYVPILHYLPHIKALLPWNFPTKDFGSRDSHYYTNDRLESYLHTSGLGEYYHPIASCRNYEARYHDFLFGLALRSDVERQLT
ncbi:hypothetical protein BGZ96_012304 [Linnemannia gamsii]|uniref:Uncharacterized protein n=1 Tax=Linnemannia gamsii TaxID=64522 RepID=A0ABQ7KDK0_9FUNG|nr:hypothetical protein BGZ96_012304 [Linnemannia gamsii]